MKVTDQDLNLAQAAGWGLRDISQELSALPRCLGRGDGPTASFLYPLPRDYRKGLFKFTSTPSGAKPHRDDLRRTIKNGLHGTSMPAFDALLAGPEIEQVIDYVTFLSMRGETELALIEEASISDEKDPNTLSDEVAREAANGIFNKWKLAQTQVLNPPTPRPPSSRESKLRPRPVPRTDV